MNVINKKLKNEQNNDQIIRVYTDLTSLIDLFKFSF